MPIWERSDPRRQALIDRRCATADAVATWVRECGQGGLSGQGGQSNYAEPAANAMLTLLAVACAMLDRQITAQADAFEKDGGFTERLYRVRSTHRSAKPTRFTK